MKSVSFGKLKTYAKYKIIGTQYEWESHIRNVFRIFDRNLKEYAPRNLLDVGCGRGDRTIRIASYFNLIADNIFGLDYNDEYLSACEKKFLTKKIDLEFDRFPFVENRFDIVVCNQVLEHIKNYKHVIRELIKVTKSGGYVVIGIPNLAHLINRIYLLIGLQPMCIHLNGSHVRGFTHRGFYKLLKSYHEVKLVDCTGELIYPLPYFMTKLFPEKFIGLAGYICYLLKKK